MTWVKIDDGFPEHPKLLQAGPLGGWLHVCGLCYCNRNLTDGHIPRAAARRLADVEFDQHVQELVAAGLWEETDGGWLIHDYLDYNPSREEVLAKRLQLAEARAEAGRKGAEARWHGKPIANAANHAPLPDGKSGSTASADGKTMANEGDAIAKNGEWQNDGPIPSRTHPDLKELAPEKPAHKPAKPRDELWDALTEALGTEPKTNSERGRRNKALKELRAVDATPDDIQAHAQAFRQTWPNLTLTETGLVAHWTRFDKGAQPTPTSRCDHCGASRGEYHTASCPRRTPEAQTHLGDT